MKKFITPFLLIFLFTALQYSSGQTYHPFPDTLAEWSEGTGYCYVSNTRDCSGSGYIYTMAGDTLIDGIEYTLLGYNLAYSWGNSSPEINYPYQSPGEIFGALREDASHKVWFRNFDSLLNWVGCLTFFPFYFSFPTDTDMLLYDFELEVGDTAYWTAYEYGQVVKKVDSIQLLDGSWRKVLAFDTLLNFFGPDYWIEGIGSQWGLFGPYCKEPFEAECNLNCFKKTDTLLLENPAFYSLADCNHLYTTAFSQALALHNFVFPNPASTFITFDFSIFAGKNCAINIYNATGQNVHHISGFNASELTIPVSDIGKDGLYLYTVAMQQSHEIFTGKFLIQR